MAEWIAAHVQLVGVTTAFTSDSEPLLYTAERYGIWAYDQLNKSKANFNDTMPLTPLCDLLKQNL